MGRTEFELDVGDLNLHPNSYNELGTAGYNASRRLVAQLAEVGIMGSFYP